MPISDAIRPEATCEMNPDDLAALDGFAQYVGQLLFDTLCVRMIAVAVGRFEEEDIRSRIGLRLAKNRNPVPADIAREVDGLLVAAGDLGLEFDG